MPAFSFVSEGIMKKRLRLLLALALALGLIVALALPTSHFAIMGALRRESFYQGRPTSYWISALKKDAFLGDSVPTDVGRILREGGEAAVPVLVEMVNDPDEYVSMQALLALGVMSPHPTSAVPALIECLKSRVYRSEYLSLLVGILIHADRQRAIEAFIQALRENEDSDLRARIAQLLGILAPGNWSAVVQMR